ncbi:hypothetical protein OR571_09260 [Psychrobacillus sp. NEAU-3TGS]|uniref:hypothetical protein n=1 Tax=Psychrobacillus sp. NEAU-3TGS TaxID=2995412 RepID=UPI0024968F6F|nr:hypothetical protein [Psychrobacillus sp. NEAU-3TGS]MDI2587284.1 hypothetical protein [Psychrobacillus sp. NEAU-3TGS]
METWIHNMEDMFNNHLTDIHFQTDRWAELASCSPPLTFKTPTNEAEVCLREVEEEKSAVDTGLEVVDGILTGLFDVGKDFVTGIVDIIQDPKATLDATVEAVTNPVETFNAIKSAISTSYERDMVNGDANSRAHWVTYALGTVATSIVGTKGVGALTKSGVAATKAAVPRVSGAVNNASASLANLLPYGPRPQFAIAGEVPYNAVNANGLKDQIISMARVESAVKSTGKDLSKSPRNKPGVVNESFKLDRSLQTQTKLMYNKGAIGVLPNEIRKKLIDRQFNSFDDFRKEFWKSVANSSFEKEFNNRNVARMLEGNAPIAPKVEHYGKHKSYILHHKQPIDKGGEVYNLDNIMITSPKMHQDILDPAYHFGKKGQ